MLGRLSPRLCGAGFGQAQLTGEQRYCSNELSRWQQRLLLLPHASLDHEVKNWRCLDVRRDGVSAWREQGAPFHQLTGELKIR